jgi:hypothetical protein
MEGSPGVEEWRWRGVSLCGYAVSMTRKQKEAHVRRAMAAGRPRRPTLEPADRDLLHGESVGQAGSMDVLNEVNDASALVVAVRGA